MMVGSFFFMKYNSDWEYTGIYDMLMKRALKKQAAKQNFDLDKAEELRAYVKNMEAQLGVFEFTHEQIWLH